MARVRAQAKINLFLHVGPPSPDARGFHELRTAFHRIDLADEIEVRVGNGSERSLRCTGPMTPPGGLGPRETNLAFRAAEAYSARAGWPRGFSIELTKHIPVGGGLGGGSADAGAVLRTLQRLAPQPLSADALHELAASLGSDVAFLASEDILDLATGRGERLQPVPPAQVPPSAELLLVIPDFAVSTADAYRWLDDARARTGERADFARSGLVEMLAPQWLIYAHGQFAGNDFESAVEARHPRLREYRERLAAAGALVARMSGSGSTVFGLFEGTAPRGTDLGIDAVVIATRTSSRVVQVEVQE
ncbi:MAG TPA: 4-(cytidine 5'-diphospho)-2-C-methyl-D-erythritol kinase [Gemmatimonadaceae bacterium]|nr:4-(cytidine 5'-diphospho)-2-C-methyl-D-erythritol kinase [Gemmatimonadaceae bacterium]